VRCVTLGRGITMHRSARIDVRALARVCGGV
jgi:hypothetical protein